MQKHLCLSNILLILIFLVGIFTRFYLLGTVPGGLNQDEASMGYDSYALLKYGIDRNGQHNPVHFVSWGSGQNALLTYISMPFIAVLGLNVFSIRLFPAIFSVFGLIIFYFLCKKINEQFALFAFFLLAINPWHIMLGRWALESSILPGFILLSMYFLIRTQEKKNATDKIDKFALVLPLSAFAISLYAYSSAYAFVPMFLFVYILYSLFARIFSFKQWLIGLAAFFVFASPIILFVIINKFGYNTINLGILTIPKLPTEARYSYMSAIFGDSFFTGITELIKNTLSVIIDGKDLDGAIISNVTQKGGVHPLYWLSLPLFCIGFPVFIYECIKEGKKSLKIPIILWLFIAMITAIMATPAAIHRMSVIWFPLLLLSSYGLYIVYKFHKQSAIVLIVFYVIFFFRFENLYYNEYQKDIEYSFFTGCAEAIKYAEEKSSPTETLYLTGNLNQPYIQALFALKYDVHDYIKTVYIPNRGSSFESILSFGRFKIIVTQEDLQKGRIFILRSYEFNGSLDSNDYSSKSFKDFKVLIRK
jgi:4-amino-4-deoxy-L-arabinose transferase-like glycosyltransferase